MTKNHYSVIQCYRAVPVALLVVATLLLALNRAAAEVVEIKVMSFNIRYSHGGLDEEKTENNWTDAEYPRRERVIRAIRDYRPDVLGVQEARELQIVDLREALPELEFYGVGRDDGKKAGEYAGIFYRKDRFKRTDGSFFWLSATPQTPGTSFHTAPDAVPRIATWVQLAEAKSGRQILVLNTHWDHISAPARQKSAQLIRQWLRTITNLTNSAPTVVMGDLNGPEDSPEVVQLIGDNDATGRKLIDSFRKLHPQRSPDESTFGGWEGTTAGSRIDFILHTEEFPPVAAAILRTSYDGRWPSDHYPVTATLRLATED